jgi:hypothetical protein
MQFQIPQFIEVEDKIVGPLTLRQFLYLAGAAAISFVLFFLLQLWLWFLITFILAALAIAAAFIKYNSQPLPRIAWLALNFLWRPRLYLWQREAEFKELELKGRKFEISAAAPNLKKLWQDLTTRKTPIPKREKVIRLPGWEKTPKERFQLFRKLSGEKEIARRVDYR